MVSVEDTHHSNSARIQLHSMYASFHSPSSASSTRIWREKGRSMRTVRSTLFSPSPGSSGDSPPPATPAGSTFVSENLTDSVMDIRLNELASRTAKSVKSSFAEEDFLFDNLSHSFSDYSVCSSDISGELQRLATTAVAENGSGSGFPSPDLEPEPCAGFLQRENFSTEIIESISPEDLQPTVKLCVDSLSSPSAAIKRSAAAKLRLLAKNRADNRVLIAAESGAVPALVSLLKCTDPWTQEHAVTAILNLSLHPDNKLPIAEASGSIKSLIYVLKTGTETSKQNAAAALMSLAMVEETTRLTIGASGAIPPLVALLMNGNSRGKKDALTTLYKLCSARLNKERAVSAGAVVPLVALVAEQGTGMAEKALVVLSSLAGIEVGRVAIVQEGGIPALVEAVEDSSPKAKEFAVGTLLQLCAESVRNRGLLVAEGAIPPLVALSQAGTARAKNKAEALLAYLREPRHPEGSSSTP